MREECISFDDVPEFVAPKKDPRDYLPEELKERAVRLAPEKAYTLLTLAPEGEGHNASLLTVAATCYRMGVSYDDTLDHLEAAYNADRMDYQIAPTRAVKRVWGADGDMSKILDSDADYAPDIQEDALIRFRRTPSTSIVTASPGPLDATAAEIVGNLFKPEQIINIQSSAYEYGTLVEAGKIDEFLAKHKCRLEDYKFLNPAHFKQLEGVPNTKHKDQKVSTRCNDNVKARPWMVLEMDSDELARLERFNTFVFAMAQFAPLVLAVDTGNKSIHFWFDATGLKAKVRTAFFNTACIHGADKRLAVKSQIARMPNTSSSDIGRGPQRVIYFDPKREQTNDWDLKGFETFLNQNKQLDYYYHGGNKTFYTRDNLESWVSLDRTSLRSHLAEKGFRDQKAEGEPIAPMDLVINGIQMDKNVEAVVGGASGRHAGVYEENGHRIIVTKSPVFIKPRRGEFPTIAGFLEGLLDHTPGQKDVFYGWLSSRVKCLRNEGKRQALWAPAQMLHIMGPPNSGKTLILQDILAPCFANRTADASPLFKKQPDMHNPDTFGCELLYLDDSPVLEVNYAFRQEFGERIKSHIVGIGGGMRGMHQARLNIRPWWAFVRLMNMEPSTLATLPPLDDGVEDKLIFLRGESMEFGPLGAEMRLPGWYQRVKTRMQREMPAFLHFLMEEYELPDHLKDPGCRYPVLSYKEPQTLLDIKEGSPEMNIMYKIDHDSATHLFGDPLEDLFDTDERPDEDQPLAPWTGDAEALYECLSLGGSRGAQARFYKICPNPRILISQMRALEKLHPERVSYSGRTTGAKSKGKGYWIIQPKPDDVNDMM